MIGYIAAAGPDKTDQPRTRLATTATPAELARGKALFMGTVRASSGDASCASCHTAGASAAARRATPGDLTHIYSRFQDGALTAFLKHPCFRRAVGTSSAPALSDDEAFSIKAFLQQVDRVPSAQR